MSWAMRRRGLVAAIVVVVLALVGIWGYFAFLHDEPSCADHRQNKNEEGVDCGGVCARLCAPSLAPPKVSFVRPVISGPGRMDVIAYIENPNLSAEAVGTHYVIELYDENNAVIAKKAGVVDLLPKRNPVFVPNFFSGNATSLRAFLTFDDEYPLDWWRYDDTRVTLSVRDVVIEHTDTLPRIRAVIENPSTNRYKNVPVVITVFDEKDNAIAASQTVVPTLASEGRADLIFTWNAPFAGTAVREEILPILPDPS